MKLILPIAGKGSRFLKEADRNPEYKKPKPLISVRGLPMVRWATGSLPFVCHSNSVSIRQPLITARDIIFLPFQGHENDFHISSALRAIYGQDIHVIFVPEELRCGAAATALAARKFIDTDEPIIISDADHFFDGQALLDGLLLDQDIGGLIPVFEVPENDPKWSFSRIGQNNIIDKVAEKQQISNWANIGAYYFGKGKDFVAAALETIANGERINNEFYIAPLYNKLIEKGIKIKAVFPKYVYGLGTPADLEKFIKECPYNLK